MFGNFSLNNIENKFHEVEDFVVNKINPNHSAPQPEQTTVNPKDSVNINKYNTASNVNTQRGVSFSAITAQQGGQTAETMISNINQIQDPNQRSAKLRDLMVTMLDNDDFIGAIKAVNATPSLMYRNAMFKGLIQELVSDNNYDAAINLINQYSDNRVKNEMKAFVSYYANTYANDSSLAARVQGDQSFGNIAKLKTESIMGSVGKFFSGIGSSVSSVFSNPKMANKMAQGAEDTVGKRFRYAYLDNGNKACAYSVSQMIKGVPGLEGVSSAECNDLANQLSKKGFTKAYSNGYKPIQGHIDYKPGDIVFFARSGKSGYGHVGMVSEVKNGIPYMVNNSSSKREVVKVRLDQYYKVPVAVFRAPNK